MTLTDFLVARSVEALDALGCDYRRRADGDLVCACADPSAGVTRTLGQLDLIQWCDSQESTGDLFLRLLADGYATHSDYRPEWHRIDTVDA